MPTLRLSWMQLGWTAVVAAPLAACGDPGAGNVFGNAGGNGGSSDVTSLFAGAGGGDGGSNASSSTKSSASSSSTPSSSSQGVPSSAAASTVTSASGGCTADDYACLSTGECIPGFWACDGFTDCADGSDEAPINVACSSVVSSVASSSATGGCEVPCGDGAECVLPTDVCDGQNDCANDADERGCNAGEWRCNEDYYGAGDGCDCGCGTRDPDCLTADATACEFCNGEGSCAAACEQIRDDQNWRCNDG